MWCALSRAEAFRRGERLGVAVFHNRRSQKMINLNGGCHSGWQEKKERVW